MRAEVVDERSDIWGLGAILFEMLTGRPPFLGDTLPAVYSAVLNEAPPPLESLRPGVPSGLDDVVQRCLEKNPGQRFCDVADLAEAIAPYAGAAGRSAERVTRILTNPDAARKRQSLLPGGDAASGMRVSSTRLSLGSDADRGKVLSNGGEGMMGNSDWRDSDRPAVEGAPRAETVLEGDGERLGAVHDHESWRPSRPATSGEFSPMTATGARTGGAHRRGMSKGWVKVLLGAAFAIALAAVFWPRRTSAPAGEEPGLAETPKLEAPPGAAAQPLVEPKVTPVVERAQDGPKDTIQSRAEALRPPPRAKPPASLTPPPPPKPPSPAVAPPRPALTAPVEPKPERLDEDLPASHPAAPPRPPATHADDPWDPGSFGDRR
jgi:serine/threonine-protein kinase